MQGRLDAMLETVKKNAEFKTAISVIDIEIAPLVMLKQDLERELATCGDGISVSV